MDRNATDKEKATACPTLKDNDFRDDKRTIDLGPDQKQIFVDRIKRDVNVRQSTINSSNRLFLFLVSG